MDASFTCNSCDVKFSRKDNWKSHMMRTQETVFKDGCCIDAQKMCHFSGVRRVSLVGQVVQSSQIRVPKLERKRGGEKFCVFQ